MTRKVRTFSRSGMSPQARLWAVSAVTAFILLDILLVVWAFGATRSPADAGEVMTPISPSERITPAPTVTVAPVVVSQAVPATRVLGAVNGEVAWRAATGACPTAPAILELTTDAGATWSSHDAGGPTGVKAVQSIVPQSAEVANVVALSRDGCTPTFVRTFVSGDNWEEFPDGLDGVWLVDPVKRGTVYSPKGAVKAPCASAIQVAPRDDTHAAVLCNDHRVFRTADGGTHWGNAAVVAGAVALSESGSGYVVASTGLEQCAGVAVSSLGAASGDASAVGCYATPAPAAGTVALTNGDGTLWLWAGKAVVRSTNGGVAWQ